MWSLREWISFKLCHQNTLPLKYWIQQSTILQNPLRLSESCMKKAVWGSRKGVICCATAMSTRGKDDRPVLSWALSHIRRGWGPQAWSLPPLRASFQEDVCWSSKPSQTSSMLIWEKQRLCGGRFSRCAYSLGKKQTRHDSDVDSLPLWSQVVLRL